MVSIVECGLMYHASAIRAARRIARSLLAAIQIGGCGRCTGRMFIRTPSSLTVSLSWVTESSDHRRLTRSRYSSKRLTLCPFGTANASNSMSR